MNRENKSFFKEHRKLFDVEIGKLVRLPRFRELSPELYISPRYNNGEFDYWLVIEARDGNEDAADYPPNHHVSLFCISISEAESVGELQKALDCCGMGSPFSEISEDMKVYALATYGTRALLYYVESSNRKNAMRAARIQAHAAEGLLGFYLDTPQNGLGATGWDLLRGNVWGRLRD